MSLKEQLKSNDLLRCLVKRSKNHIEFLSDAKDFSDHYSEMAEKKGDFRYRLMLLIHQLEKGMCRQDARPYGKDKVQQIIRILEKESFEECNLFEYKLAKASLLSWLHYHDEKGWKVEAADRLFIEKNCLAELKAGRELFFIPEKEIKSGLFSDIIFSRRSVRDYKEEPLRQEDIDFALDCFIEAPTACNRQMCKVYKVDDSNKRDLLIQTILGVGGFNTKCMTLFVITYDTGALEFYGERNQGYVNVGLTAMNFANGLHARGIGSCFMQWSNKRNDDRKIRKALGIQESERIGLVLGAGYYKDKTYIPCSTRKTKENIFEII